MAKPSRKFHELELQKEEKKKPTWAGAAALLQPTTAGTKEDKEKNLIIWTAKALGVSPFGITILANGPYINKLGLRQKAKEYHGKVSFERRWVQYAKDDVEKAVCEVRMLDKTGRPLTDFVLGECSPSTIRMGTLKGFQNSMAQTRAINRAIMEADGIEIHEDLIAGIERLQAEKATALKPEIAEKIVRNAFVSAEEMEISEKPASKIVGQDKDSELRALYDYAVKKGAKVGEEQTFIEQMLGHKVDFTDMTLAKVLGLKTELLLRSNSNGKNNQSVSPSGSLAE